MTGLQTFTIMTENGPRPATDLEIAEHIAGGTDNLSPEQKTALFTAKIKNLETLVKDIEAECALEIKNLADRNARLHDAIKLEVHKRREERQGYRIQIAGLQQALRIVRAERRGAVEGLSGLFRKFVTTSRIEGHRGNARS